MALSGCFCAVGALFWRGRRASVRERTGTLLGGLGISVELRARSLVRRARCVAILTPNLTSKSAPRSDTKSSSFLLSLPSSLSVAFMRFS